MKLSVYNQNGETTGEEIELNPRIFAVAKVKNDVVHFAATAALSNMRNPIASTKTRGEVRGGGKKPWKQKGTGRARAGSIRSPLWRGGGIIFGPTPERNFTKKVNKKVRQLARKMVLTSFANEQRIAILDRLDLPEPKTREVESAIQKFVHQKEARKIALILPQKEEKVMTAARNLPHVKVLVANNLNLLDLLWAEKLVILKNALEVMQQRKES